MDARAAYRGCLVGGAAGDALGYAVEFLDEQAIRARYGTAGITAYELDWQGVAEISDDTQMTLYTANGLLLCAAERRQGLGSDWAEAVGRCYRDWLRTQQGGGAGDWAWLNDVPALHHPRAPGNTCMGALAQPMLGSIARPINASKGCGGVMRVAPVGLFLGESMAAEELQRVAAECAALTHGHPLGYIPAGMLAHLVHLAAHEPALPLGDAVAAAMATARTAFAGTAPEQLARMDALVELALQLAEADMDDPNAIHRLGEGWVGEEALAIAIYCAVKYAEDFDRGMIAAVNHRGDSDSTGAVAGNILGARLGLAGIPPKYRRCLELTDVLLEVADDLLDGPPAAQSTPAAQARWAQKYEAHHRAE